jgi:hypothetical protein
MTIGSLRYLTSLASDEPRSLTVTALLDVQSAHAHMFAEPHQCPGADEVSDACRMLQRSLDASDAGWALQRMSPREAGNGDLGADAGHAHPVARSILITD